MVSVMACKVYSHHNNVNFFHGNIAPTCNMHQVGRGFYVLSDIYTGRLLACELASNAPIHRGCPRFNNRIE